MTVESATISDDGMALILQIDGVPAEVSGVKPGLLQMGFVVLAVPGDVSESFTNYWKEELSNTRVQATDFDEVIPGATDNPVIVALTHRWLKAREAGVSLPVPSVQEALDELDW